ncbi:MULTISPECIES: arsenate reductase family protein [Maribacter]|jgi:arsenate reductase-like glutaredoxin family protein|uniref:Arsenate reductase, glutaredoxin family n=1 Tax=Maribacter stanieri TaxID=440514 RepID=A0A1I6HRM3_9FLAO|nr:MULTISPECIES: arsenate reductase [Maribacter]SFR57095.1 Arsenate reductase, glutaredoxin family [Maribacter stanieri]|tara:strand:+ start:1223 stop:1633 length:411 start_codon:yes stop_codon:yes gene_type:complete
MGVIAMDKKQITLYYSSENSIGKQLNAYVESSGKDNLTIDISKTNVTGTQWAELADGLGKKISELVNTEHPDFKDVYGEDTIDLDDDGWLKILNKYPSFLKNAIVIKGEEYIELTSASDFKQYMDPDSAGIEKPYK